MTDETEAEKAARLESRKVEQHDAELEWENRKLSVAESILQRRAALDANPVWLDTLRAQYEAQGRGWFVGLSEDRRASPNAWLCAMRNAVELIASNHVTDEVKAELKSWMNVAALKGFLEASIDTGRP